MQELLIGYTIKLWGISWPLIKKVFDYCLFAWNFIWPYLNKTFEFLANMYIFVRDFIQDLLHKISSFLGETYQTFQPIAVNFAEKNHTWAAIILVLILLILVFWIWMLRHAHKNEIWKKSWEFIIIILGPIGALAYLVRKKYLERKQWKHDKVMMSFFSPLSQKPNETKKTE